MKRTILEKLVNETDQVCATISLNTHRTHPANVEDTILLKNLLKEAEARIIDEYGKRPMNELLEKIQNLESEIDMDYNLDSLHIFLSNNTKEVIKSPWPTPNNLVHISDKFAIKPLIKVFNRTEEYLILLLSNSEVKLFHALNDSIYEEITNDDFPFSKHLQHVVFHDKPSDGKHSDNVLNEFMNKLDKAVLKIYNETGMKCVVVCTESNYGHLMQVSDKPSIYYGHNYKQNTSNHSMAIDSWALVNNIQLQRVREAVAEIQEAVGNSKVITDLSEIFRAVKEGRGDLLVIHEDFSQAVKIIDEFSIELVTDVTLPGVTDDISSELAWEVISKKGRALFTNQSEIKSLGNIALKVRY